MRLGAYWLAPHYVKVELTQLLTFRHYSRYSGEVSGRGYDCWAGEWHQVAAVQGKGLKAVSANLPKGANSKPESRLRPPVLLRSSRTGVADSLFAYPVLF